MISHSIERVTSDLTEVRVLVPPHFVPSLLSFLDVKKRQVPSDPAKLKRERDEYLKKITAFVADSFASALGRGLTYNQSISAALAASVPHFPNLTYELVKTLVRKSGYKPSRAVSQR